MNEGGNGGISPPPVTELAQTQWYDHALLIIVGVVLVLGGLYLYSKAFPWRFKK